MKKFILKMVVFLGIVILYKLSVFCYIYHALPERNEGKTFTGEMGTDKPRIILLGSSNIVHNYDFRHLNAYYKDYDVIGCRYSEPSGIYSILKRLDYLDLDEKDILVVCAPHSHYEQAKFLNLKSNSKQGFSKSLIIDAFIDFPFASLRSLFSIKPWEIDKASKTNPPDVITDKTFEAEPALQSDSLYTACWTNPEDMFKVVSPGFDEDYLKDLHTWMVSSFPCKVWFRFPAVRAGEFELNAERIEYLEGNFEFINTFNEAVYSDELWYNQWYHLNKCGRDLSTQKFIEEMDGGFNVVRKS